MHWVNLESSGLFAAAIGQSLDYIPFEKLYTAHAVDASPLTDFTLLNISKRLTSFLKE